MKHSVLKGIFLGNHILFIFHMCRLISAGTHAGIESAVPMFLSSLMVIDITYISSCNIRENKVVSLFCALLAADGWYMLLLIEKSRTANMLFTIFSPVIWYASIRFIFMFLFQGAGYKFKKTTDIILLASCIGSLAGACISQQAFAAMYGIQFLLCIVCFLFIICCHRRRAAFVLKSEWKCMVISAAVTAASFLIYYFVTLDFTNHISNFGIYLPVLLFFMSVHGIVQKEHNSFPLSAVFDQKQAALIICLSGVMIAGIIFLLGGGYAELLIAVNALSVILYIGNIVLGQKLKQGQGTIMKESRYDTALRLLQQEEMLKMEFSNFLHDDVLQDLLSVKNMMGKSHIPDIRDIIVETLNDLNIRIRKQMQDYHPVMLKNLTAEENYQNLFESLSQTFWQRSIAVSFDCSDTLFLAEPYNVLIYRLLKELLTNVYKHSNGNRAWVAIAQEDDMIRLRVSDNGTADATVLTLADVSKHKGIASIKEQINSLEGIVVISNHTPCGISVQISLPMKGDVSYQYFVS